MPANSQIPSDTLPMRTYVPATQQLLLAERPDGADEDVHFPRAVAAAAVLDLSRPGDRVLDPFAGFGTTLRVATELGRSAVGVELLPERCAIAQREAPGAQVIEGDARGLNTLVRGPFQLILTSPPYRTALDHPPDPLAAYTRDGGDYGSYLASVTAVLGQCLNLLTPDGHLVVNVANIAAAQGFTPLAWDVGQAISEVGDVVQDVPVCWDQPPHDLAGDHLIVVRQRRSAPPA